VGLTKPIEPAVGLDFSFDDAMLSQQRALKYNTYKGFRRVMPNPDGMLSTSDFLFDVISGAMFVGHDHLRNRYLSHS
jgi:hypothetical protein